MGSQQIQIAHDETDTRQLISWLSTQAPLRCLPATARKMTSSPAALDTVLDGDRMAIFLAEDEEHVLAASRLSPDDSTLMVVTNPDNHGWIFQWTRTRVDQDGVYVPTGVGGSRIYYSEPGSKSSAKIRRLVVALIRKIRKTSPWTSDERHPVYVGESLGTKVRSGSARLVHPNGAELVLVPNATFSR